MKRPNKQMLAEREELARAAEANCKCLAVDVEFPCWCDFAEWLRGNLKGRVMVDAPRIQGEDDVKADAWLEGARFAWQAASLKSLHDSVVPHDLPRRFRDKSPYRDESKNRKKVAQ